MALRLLPMLATAGAPGDVVGPAWAHEFKWDGVRALVVSDGQRVQLRSRLGNDVTDGYPELQGLASRATGGDGGRRGGGRARCRRGAVVPVAATAHAPA